MDDANDLPSLYYADEPTAREKMAAMVAALRGQQGLASVAQLTGDPVLSKFGTGLAGSVQHQQDALAEVPQGRARLAQEDLTLQKGQREQAAMTNPATAGFLRKAYAAAGMPVDDNVPTEALTSPIVEKLVQAHEASEARKAQYSGLNFFRTQALQDREEKQTYKQMQDFAQSLDPLQRTSGLSKVAQRLQSIESGLGGVIAPGDDLNNLNSQKMYELARVYDRVVSNGQPTQGGTTHLVPSTALGSAADFAQWLGGSPVGKQQGKFAQQMLDALNRERDIATNQITTAQRSRIARAAKLAEKDPTGFENSLRAAGLDPADFDSQTWLYKGQPKAAPAPGGAPGAGAAPKMDPAIVQQYKASLQPGERLVIDPTGNAHALSAGEALPQGFTEVP